MSRTGVFVPSTVRPASRLGAVAIATALVMVVLCAAAAANAAKRGGILEFAVDAEPADYDCHSNVSFAFLHPVAPHYSTLLKFDAANYPQVEGDVAESWSVSADKLTYTFRLRPDVHFHDGSRMTSADVKASYERVLQPPPGVVSARRVSYAAIADIAAPDPGTVVFRLKWPDAAMLANFASPWNCIYSAAKLRQDPLYPSAHVMGSGPFVFVEHEKGSQWTGRRWEGYFRPGQPYLDGYQADFITGAKVVKALREGRVQAEFRSVTPSERDELVSALGEDIDVQESPWLTDLLLVFNTKRPPFDDARVRRALSLAIDRWRGAEGLSESSFLKYVGGLLRPGFEMATPAAALADLPGFSRDIESSRAAARQLLAESGATGLTVTLTNRDIPMPYAPGADYLIAAWRAIGVEVQQVKLGTRDWQAALETGRFEAAIDFGGDYFDDPTQQLAKYVSRDLSPANYSNATDRFLDALYVGQAVTPDPRKRAQMVRDFEKHALTEAYTVPILWWNRIVVTSAKLKGWSMTPSHYLGQDLASVWLEQ